MSQLTLFQSCQDGSFWVETSTKQRIKCFAQGHNTVSPPVVSLKPVALRSRVKHSTTEPLRSPSTVV